MKRKMSLEDELDVTRTSVAELTGWCITIALHELFGIGRERLNRVNNRQRMLAEQSMAIMMQPNERGMPSTEKARRMRAEALPESVPREFRVPALRAARNRREQQLKIVGGPGGDHGLAAARQGLHGGAGIWPGPLEPLI